MLTKNELLSMLKSVKKADARDTAAAELRAQILRALTKLPYKQKIIIHSHYVEGEKWERIAAQNGISTTHCKLLRNKAVDTLVLNMNEKS